MHTTQAKLAPKRRRRHHDAQFKARVVAACRHPGVSIAAIALANALNANLVRRWIHEDEETHALPSVQRRPLEQGTPVTAIPVTLDAPPAPPTSDIRLDLSNADLAIQIAWPVTHATSLGVWLKDLLS